jgi:hypothetical protein
MATSPLLLTWHFILAAQIASERAASVEGADLVQGVHLLRETMADSSNFSSRVGFVPASSDKMKGARSCCRKAISRIQVYVPPCE